MVSWSSLHDKSLYDTYIVNHNISVDLMTVGDIERSYKVYFNFYQLCML